MTSYRSFQMKAGHFRHGALLYNLPLYFLCGSNFDEKMADLPWYVLRETGNIVLEPVIYTGYLCSTGMKLLL